MKKSTMKIYYVLLLICILGMCFSACGSQGKGNGLPAATPKATSTPTPTEAPTPTPTSTATPTPTPTPTPVPTPTPPAYREIAEEDYRTLFNRETSSEELAGILQFLPVGSYEEGITAIAAKNAWESVYMTDNMSIGKMFDVQFDYGKNIITGDVSELFAWLGTVNNKNVHNDPVDSSIVVDGSSLTIDLTQCTHKDWYTPEIVMGMISEEDLYLYYTYSTIYDSSVPDVFRTAVFVKDGTGKYQLSQIVDREAGSVAPAKPEYNFSFLSDQIKESGNIWEGILSSGRIPEYVSQWPVERKITQYAVLDIDGNGTTELVISSDTDGIGFSTFAVLALDPAADSIKPVMFRDYTGIESPCAMCHNGLRYSKKYQALVYKPMNNGSMFGSFEFHGLQAGEDSLLFCVNYDTMAGSGAKSYTYSKGDESESITEDQYRAYLEEAASMEFQPIK